MCFEVETGVGRGGGGLDTNWKRRQLIIRQGNEVEGGVEWQTLRFERSRGFKT